MNKVDAIADLQYIASNIHARSSRLVVLYGNHMACSYPYGADISLDTVAFNLDQIIDNLDRARNLAESLRNELNKQYEL